GASGHLRPVSAALRVEPLVCVARAVAIVAVGRDDSAAADRRKSQRVASLSRRPVLRTLADPSAASSLEVLVHGSGHEAANWRMVAPEGAGAVFRCVVAEA